MKQVSSYPLAHEMAARQLEPGMTTFIRVKDADGNIKFRPDLLLGEQLASNCGGIHFDAKRMNGTNVETVVACYDPAATVWAKSCPTR
jgi:hypothetical protein